MIKWVHYWLQEWGEWHSSYMDRSAIGYPGSCSEARAGEGSSDSQKGPKVPDVWMNERVGKVDKMLRRMEAEWQDFASNVYVRREKLKRRDYVKLDKLHQRIEAIHRYL